MKKKTVIWILCAVVIGAAAGTAIWWYQRSQAPVQASDEMEAEEDELGEHMTNSVIYFEGEIPPADPLMVGRWANEEKAGWHKVYYDDDDGEGRYWGKEWDEADDVLEEDLGYHGNGWFRWTKSNDTLTEFSTMDFRDVPIAHTYKISMIDSMHIVMTESNRLSSYHFAKE